MAEGLNVEEELKEAVARVVASASQRKLIVAGPGTGKTYLFRKLLEAAAGGRRSRLVVTFINNLKADLERDLGQLAEVFTLHGYCFGLLKKRQPLRRGLTPDFQCLPALPTLVKSDWTYTQGGSAPHFIEGMRNLNVDAKQIEFYLRRSRYYDAVAFDDSVYRVFSALQDTGANLGRRDLVLVDEYQDFNRLEAALLEKLAETSPVVIAGDDDQALYSQLRGASWDFIRKLHVRGDYEVFQLPFCLRCPEVVVGAVNDTIARAAHRGGLAGRIQKPYRFFEPKKGDDSRRYPHLLLVKCSTQRQGGANYFGKYIEEEIRALPTEEVEEAERDGFPAMLVIGPKQYLRQIADHLAQNGIEVDIRRDAEEALRRGDGLRLLREDTESNLGWRVVIECDAPPFAADVVRRSAIEEAPLAALLPHEWRAKILGEVEALPAEEEQVPTAASERPRPWVKLTSFEGAKGLSAQHVHLVGLHNGDLPRKPDAVQDIEVCRFVVGLTRARKKCSLLLTRNFGGQWKDPSLFLTWIKPERFEAKEVSKAYWEGKLPG